MVNDPVSLVLYLIAHHRPFVPQGQDWCVVGTHNWCDTMVQIVRDLSPLYLKVSCFGIYYEDQVQHKQALAMIHSLLSFTVTFMTGNVLDKDLHVRLI